VLVGALALRSGNQDWMTWLDHLVFKQLELSETRVVSIRLFPGDLRIAILELRLTG
jgi:hypothetical protein